MTGGHRGRSLVLVLLLLSVLAVFGFWEIRHSFEKNLRTDLVRIVRQAYEGQAEIGSVHLNLLTGNVRFRNVRFRFPLGQSGEYRTLFDFPGVDGHLSLLSLLTRVYDFPLGSGAVNVSVSQKHAGIIPGPASQKRFQT